MTESVVGPLQHTATHYKSMQHITCTFHVPLLCECLMSDNGWTQIRKTVISLSSSCIQRCSLVQETWISRCQPAEVQVTQSCLRSAPTLSCDTCPLLHTTMENCAIKTCPTCTIAAPVNDMICVSFQIQMILSQPSFLQSQATWLIYVPCKLLLMQTPVWIMDMWSITITENDQITGLCLSSRGDVSLVDEDSIQTQVYLLLAGKEEVWKESWLFSNWSSLF